MRLRIALLLACACALIAACGALDRTEKVVITATPNAAQLAAAAGATPLLVTDSGPYENLTALLDGVCTEFLFSAAGETFVWDTPDALAAFYNRVDESEQCSGEVIKERTISTGACWLGDRRRNRLRRLVPCRRDRCEWRRSSCR